ncbi:MAG: 2-oxoacid:acceptor oxidoreductase subunit alpha [Planctomycetes bacterium]|nr:2-oxoacid:acceptor oxidoreductase subunit alpha [Planctomycetota bacterium]
MKADPKGVLSGIHYLDGDHACAEGAISAGCRFFAGYPITPSTEIAERIAARFPLVGGIFIQMEDELASMAAILGGAWAGKKSMSVTSGPGFSLMMENFGLGIMMEVPCVLVNVQRGGPSTGLPTMVGQADMMQARWGSHGDYEVIALAPDSPQEAYDFTIIAFNLAEKYRTPVLVMMDECVGHMTEKVIIPDASEIDIVDRKYTDLSPAEYKPYKPDANLVPPICEIGTGYNIHTTGLTHDENGYPVMSEQTQAELIPRLVNKIKQNADDIIIVKETDIEDADVVLISFGISSRVAHGARRLAKNKGLKVGHLRLITVWPFPEKRISELARRVKGFVMVENNLGQVFLELERVVKNDAKCVLAGHAGGTVHNPTDIVEKIEEVLR